MNDTEPKPPHVSAQQYEVECVQCHTKAIGTVPAIVEHGWQITGGAFFCPACGLNLKPIPMKS